LRYCMLRSLGYLQRVVPPRLLLQVAQGFDRKVLAVAIHKLGLPAHLPEEQLQRLRVKIKHGGFGLASAAQTSPIAHTAAVVTSAKVLSEPLVLGNLGLQPGTPL